MKPPTAASIGVLALTMGFAPVAIAQTTSPSTPGSPTTTQDKAQSPAAQTPPDKMPAEKVMPPPQTKASGDSAVTTQASGTVLGSDIIGKTVYGTDQKKIGTANDIVMKQDGSGVEAVVVGVGGFLGLGEHNVALKLEKFSFQPSESGKTVIVLKTSKEELQSLPAFKSKTDQDAETARNTPRPTTPNAPSR